MEVVVPPDRITVFSPEAVMFVVWARQTPLDPTQIETRPSRSQNKRT
jgi:hypothetical protein